jgi:hypothetical protein
MRPREHYAEDGDERKCQWEIERGTDTKHTNGVDEFGWQDEKEYEHQC